MAATNSQITKKEEVEALAETIRDGSAPASLTTNQSALKTITDGIVAGTGNAAQVARKAALTTTMASILSGTSAAPLLAQQSSLKTLIGDILSSNSGSGGYDFQIGASRTGTSENPLVSPASVLFFAFDPASDEFERDSGYYFDFDDPDSGTYTLTNRNQSKNTIISGPISGHTFVVADGSGTQTFRVLCRKETSDTTETLGYVDIYVTDQASAFSGANTICVKAPEDSGTHDGSSDAAILTDSSQSWTSDEWIGYTIRNTTDGSEGIITDNDATTITATLSGGTDNDWDSGDAYEIVITDLTAQGYDISPPSGYTLVTSPDDVDWDDIVGQRIMFFAGGDFSGGNAIRILTGNNNFVLTRFGNNASARPELPGISIGVKASGNASFDLTSAQLATAASTFSNDGWVENATLDGLRTPAVQLPMSHQHIGLHDLDMDYENEAAGGEIKFNIGNWPWNAAAEIEPSEVPYSLGTYISECAVISSTASPPNVQLNGTNPPSPHYFLLLGSYFRSSYEHNIRVHGIKLGCIQDTDALGDFQHENPKSAITLRGSGYNQVGDTRGLTKGDRGCGAATSTNDRANLPDTRWLVVQRCTVSSGNGTTGTYEISIMVTNTANHEFIHDVLVHDIVVQEGTATGDFDVLIVGRDITVTDITYSTGGNPANKAHDNGDSYELDDLTGNNRVNGSTLSTEANWLTSGNNNNNRDQTGETAYNLPTPTAPR